MGRPKRPLTDLEVLINNAVLKRHADISEGFARNAAKNTYECLRKVSEADAASFLTFLGTNGSTCFAVTKNFNDASFTVERGNYLLRTLLLKVWNLGPRVQQEARSRSTTSCPLQSHEELTCLCPMHIELCEDQAINLPTAEQVDRMMERLDSFGALAAVDQEVGVGKQK